MLVQSQLLKVHQMESAKSYVYKTTKIDELTHLHNFITSRLQKPLNLRRETLILVTDHSITQRLSRGNLNLHSRPLGTVVLLGCLHVHYYY